MAIAPQLSHPICHLSHIAGPASGSRTAVWVCEYPYRTIRMAGPSIECGDCPVWQELLRTRADRQPPIAEPGLVSDHSYQGVLGF
jgi:hypothetical protein